MVGVGNSDRRPAKGVKELVEGGINEIPEKYIKPEDCRAGEVISKGIPAIDVSEFHGDGKSEVVRAMADAASSWGFFQVINHGVPSEVITAMKDAALRFFSLPLDVKMSIFSEDPRQPLRYCSSFLPSMEERWDWHDNLQYRPLPQESWPKELEFYKEPVNKYLDSIQPLAELITEALALGLGLDPHRFDITRRVYKVRLNYYPACPSPELAMGISPHSDFGGFTVLLQNEVAGLQVRNKGKWHSVEPIPEAFVVNIADQFEILSNGRYQSAEHRAVVNSSQARLSIATFIQPEEDDLIAPLEELVSGETPARYQETVFGEYLRNQLSKRLESKNGVASRKTG